MENQWNYFINKDDNTEYKINAKIVVLAASACESARILLNSKSTYHKNGLGNSSNMVGKYLHDSTELIIWHLSLI